MVEKLTDENPKKTNIKIDNNLEIVLEESDIEKFNKLEGQLKKFIQSNFFYGVGTLVASYQEDKTSNISRSSTNAQTVIYIRPKDENSYVKKIVATNGVFDELNDKYWILKRFGNRFKIEPKYLSFKDI